jgi:hypothetical protein
MSREHAASRWAAVTVAAATRPAHDAAQGPAGVPVTQVGATTAEIIR